jgi:hypothetical protein
MKKALLVGINYLGTSSQLNGCINDVVNMKAILIEKYQYNPANIILLCDTEINAKKPTKSNILKWIRWLIDNAKSGDSLFFHYSGHGSYLRDTSGDEDDKQDEAIVPLDYRTYGIIIDDTLKVMLINNLPVGVKINIILDSCYSGTGVDLRYTYDEKKRITINNKYSESKCVSFMISGCTDKQTSADAWIPEDKKYQGALTNSVLNILKETQYDVNLSKLMEKIRNYLKEHQFTQIPLLTSGRKLDLNEKFVI